MASSGKHDFLPSREADLLAWSANFDSQINSPPGPAQFGLTVAQANAYTALHHAFVAGYTAANNANTNSRATIGAKDDAKRALKASARMLARLIRATPGVTSDQRLQLGLTVPDRHLTPVARPSDPPIVIILPSIGRTIRIRLRDKESPTRRGKPPGIAGAAIMSCVARDDDNSLPARQADWTFHGNATRHFFDVNFDSEVPAGAKIWIVASWYNTRGQLGPTSTPQCTRLGEGMAKFASAA
jgi:hypothetical protein